eukprot:355552-Chlamydomonas_euryale.AAC.4
MAVCTLSLCAELASSPQAHCCRPSLREGCRLPPPRAPEARTSGQARAAARGASAPSEHERRRRTLACCQAARGLKRTQAMRGRALKLRCRHGRRGRQLPPARQPRRPR